MILLLLCSLPLSNHCKCELIEINHTCSEHACTRQVIFWEWDQEYSRYNVRSWVLAEDVDVLTTRKVKTRGWTVEGTIRHTRTFEDPEIANRRLHPVRNAMPWEVTLPKKGSK